MCSGGLTFRPRSAPLDTSHEKRCRAALGLIERSFPENINGVSPKEDVQSASTSPRRYSDSLRAGERYSLWNKVVRYGGVRSADGMGTFLFSRAA